MKMGHANDKGDAMARPGGKGDPTHKSKCIHHSTSQREVSEGSQQPNTLRLHHTEVPTVGHVHHHGRLSRWSHPEAERPCGFVGWSSHCGCPP
eukprot:NODE_1820_length_748_cov_445.188841_g1416_i0.p2 GENE.NODE_1820_length_748_cov_445.188841_g1416_i0~~NODE_1820_length_748_cov_445.188841_g1416_i0.p2  ORF type:complete len:108 (-),score=24.91 NODE_1820_length_748_cov_445.188841_g1416_i0:423-701(-)